MTHAESNLRPPPDGLLLAIADYVCRPPVFPESAYDTARLALLDAIGCGMLALGVDECRRLLGPIVPGTRVPRGVHVPGTPYVEDPVKAAFDIGTQNRWLDFNDTWLAAEWGHPSDNFAAILAATEYAEHPWTMRDVLRAGVQAYEIQGVLALENSFNGMGLDHVVLVRVASAAVATNLLGGSREDVVNAVSNAFVDGGALRTYRHTPNTGSRKSWAAGDAASRAIRLALLTLQGEMGYPAVLSTPTWGFCDVFNGGQELVVRQPFGSYVAENVLFKVSYPAEFHAQTALEAAIALHPIVSARIDAIERIEIHTQQSAIRIISKEGPLHNPADRDHCLQFIVAVGLLHGTLSAAHYDDPLAADPRLDALRARMIVAEDPHYTADYLDSDKRSIANRVQVFFADGTSTPPAEVEFPLGHRRRRPEALPLLRAKLETNLGTRLPAAVLRDVLRLVDDAATFDALRVDQFMALLAIA